MGKSADAWQKAAETFSSSQDLGGFAACMADDVVWHSDDGNLHGKAAVMKGLQEYLAATEWRRHEPLTPIVEAAGMVAYIFRNMYAQDEAIAGAVARINDEGQVVEIWSHRVVA